MVALKEAIKNQALTEIMAKPDYVIVARKGDRARDIKIKNTDRLLSRNIAQILGGKTGYTDIARYCLAVAARTFEGRQLGMVFLGAEGRHTRFADFARVIKWLTSSEAIAAEASKVDEKRSGPSAPAITPAGNAVSSKSVEAENGEE
jgi:D-alanyl-D-alanine carboxypeptidase